MTTKRGPGRPPSKPIPPTIDMIGLVDSPEDDENKMELVFDNPLVFKSLFTYLKNIKSKELHLRFTPNDLTIFAYDHTQTSRIVAIIDGTKLNRYYCGESFWVNLNRENVDKLFASIDKSFYKIELQIKYEDERISVTFTDADLNKECLYMVVLANYEPNEYLFEAENIIRADPNEFPIEFSLSAKQFKKAITDAANYSTILTIKKVENSPLFFTYSSPSQIEYYETYYNDKRICLKSNIGEKQTFQCTIKLNNIKSFASTMVTDNVKILCHMAVDILFQSTIGNNHALVIHTLTKCE